MDDLYFDSPNNEYDEISEDDDVVSDSDHDEEDEETDDDEVADDKVPTYKGCAIIERTGDDRTTLPVLNKYERTGAIIHMAEQISKGAKVPEIAGNIDGITDTITLAYISVMSTVRKSLGEVKSEEDIAKGASIILRRSLKNKYVDVWKLHELVYFSKEDQSKTLTRAMIDSYKLNLGDWFNM